MRFNVFDGGEIDKDHKWRHRIWPFNFWYDLDVHTVKTLLSRMFRTASIQLCPGKFSLLDFWVSVFRHVLFFLMFTLRSDDLFPDFYLINFKNTILVIIYYDKVPIYTHFTTNWTSIFSCMYYPTSASCIINLSAYVWFPFTSLHFFFCRIKRWAID